MIIEGSSVSCETLQRAKTAHDIICNMYIILLNACANNYHRYFPEMSLFTYIYSIMESANFKDKFYGTVFEKGKNKSATN